MSETILDPSCTGLPHLCPKCGASVPPAQTSQVCEACGHSLVYPYSAQTSAPPTVRAEARRRLVAMGRPLGWQDYSLTTENALDFSESEVARATAADRKTIEELRRRCEWVEDGRATEYAAAMDREGIASDRIAALIAKLADAEKLAQQWQGLVLLAERLSLKDSQTRDAIKSRAAEARDHLGAALMQTIDKDDPIIMGHVRDAYRLLGGSR